MKNCNSILGTGGIHHVAMTVRDLDVSVRFYTGVLGFSQTASWGEGDARGVLLDTGDGACFEIFAGGGEPELPEGAFAHLALRTADCRAVFARVETAGMRIVSPPRDIVIPSEPPMLVTIAFFKGPDSEVIELFEER